MFITGLEEGLFPHENSIAEVEGLEEERRLMYVAITRARHRLYISFSQTRMLHGQTRYNLRSRFFDELPDAALKWLTPKQRRGGNEGWSPDWSDGFNNSRGRGGQGGGYGGQGGYGSGGGRRVDYGDTGKLGQSEQKAAQRFDRGIAWRIGQNVAHARFGEGVIINIEGSGDDARVQVNFGREGVKWLALSVAKIEARS